MTGDDLLPFALAERGDLLPRDLPPRGGLHGSKLPVGSIDDGQTWRTHQRCWGGAFLAVGINTPYDNFGA